MSERYDEVRIDGRVAVRGLDADVVCHCGELDAERG